MGLGVGVGVGVAAIWVQVVASRKAAEKGREQRSAGHAQQLQCRDDFGRGDPPQNKLNDEGR